MVQIVTTSEVPTHEQLDFWKTAIGEHFIPLNILTDLGQTFFNGKIIQYSRGGVALADVIADRHIACRTESQVQKDRKDYYMLLIQLRGTSEIEQFDRQVVMHPEDFVLCDTRHVYSMSMEESFQHEVIMLPGPMVRSSLNKPEQYMTRELNRKSGSGKLFSDFISSLRKTICTMEANTTCAVASAMVELLCAVILEQPEKRLSSPGGLRHYHLERLRSYIFEHLTDPELSIERLSEALNLSVRYLHSLFDGEPTTLNKWIWKMRLNMARQILSDPERAHIPITDVAFSIGYQSSSHFSRQFLVTFGINPRDFRKQALEKYRFYEAIFNTRSRSR